MSMRSFLVAWLVWILVGTAAAAEYKLTDGTIYEGEAASFSDDGLIIRLGIGGFSERISWIKLTQETLKELRNNPKAAAFVEPFIEIPPEVIAKKKEITVKKVERLDRFKERPGFMDWLTQPINLVILGVIFLANLFAGFEIAVFRNRAPALVCCFSALLPIAGPLFFLALPTRTEAAPDEVPEEPVAAPKADGGGVTSKVKNKLTSVFGKKQGSGLSLSAMEKPAAASTEQLPKVFNRGEFTFNRRFFETQFPGFFRVVPSESEKDLVLVFRCARNEYIGKRITRIAMNDLHLQLLSGGEVQVAFGEVSQVQVRHKDHKGK